MVTVVIDAQWPSDQPRPLVSRWATVASSTVSSVFPGVTRANANGPNEQVVKKCGGQSWAETPGF